MQHREEPQDPAVFHTHIFTCVVVTGILTAAVQVGHVGDLFPDEPEMTTPVCYFPVKFVSYIFCLYHPNF